jgi:hypothetical protein
MILSNHTKSLVAAFLCALAIFASSCAFGFGGGRGEVVEAWETTKGKFKIRVTEYKEKNPVHLTHFLYVFESSGTASGNWREIMEVKNDDDIPLPREQIRFVNDQTGYVFLNEKYAVSTDSGEAWKVWEATPKNLSKLQHDPAYIKNVVIELNGSGTMILEALVDGQVKPFTVYTKDYGQHWNQ